MAEESIFGIPIEPSEDEVAQIESNETTSELSGDEAQPEGSPAAVAAPEGEQQTPAEDAEEAPVEEIEVSEEDRQAAIEAWVASKPEGVQFAGKFDDPFQTERAYNESREMWRRANESRKAEAAARLELQERYGQLYQQMEGVVPILEQAAQRERAFQAYAEQYREQTGAYPEGYQPPAPQPALGPQDVNAMVEQRLAQERAEMQRQFAAQQEYQQLQGAVFGFYRDHPEVEPNGALDSEITDVRDNLNEAWDRYGIEVDPADPGSLEILYEASRDPALVEVLRLNPAYFESAYGMQLARRDAAVISGRVPPSTEPVTQTVPASQVKTSGVKKPYVESAAIGTGSDAEAEDENDPWVRIKNAGPVSGQGTRGGLAGSVFAE